MILVLIPGVTLWHPSPLFSPDPALTSAGGYPLISSNKTRPSVPWGYPLDPSVSAKSSASHLLIVTICWIHYPGVGPVPSSSGSSSSGPSSSGLPSSSGPSSSGSLSSDQSRWQWTFGLFLLLFLLLLSCFNIKIISF